MMASTGIGPPKQGYVLTVSNPEEDSGIFARFHRVSSDLRNCAKVPELTMVKTLVKEDKLDKREAKRTSK